MGLMKTGFTCCGFMVLLVSILIGAIFSGTATKFGVWRAAAVLNPNLVGMSPAFMREGNWRVTLDDIGKYDLEGQAAVVTGANSGLGYYTALHVAKQGAKVFMCCRTPAKCSAAADKIKATQVKGSVVTVKMDTSSLKSVKAASVEIASQTDAVDMLVLNAGIGANPFSLSEDGFENILATNQIGHHLLFNLLKPLMLSGGKTGAARVVSVSSASNFDPPPWGVALDKARMNNESGYNPMKHYGQSKLANVLFAQEVSRRASMAGEPIFANSLHPGAVDTMIWEQLKVSIKREVGASPLPDQFKTKLIDLLVGMLDELRTRFMWSGEDGALTQIWLAASQSIKEQQIRGRYFHPQAVEVQPHNEFSKDFAMQKGFYQFCEGLVAPFAS